MNLCCLSHQVCGHLLQPPKDPDTPATMGPTTKPSSELPDSLFSPQPARRGSACPPPTPTGSLTEERLLIPSVLPTDGTVLQTKGAQKHLWEEGRRGGKKGHTAEQRGRSPYPQTPGATPGQDRREGCQGQEPVRTAKGAAAGRYSHALQNAGLRLGGGRANALCRGQCHRPEPVLSLPSSSEPSLVPSSTPHLLMVCENLRKADTVPALKRETTQQGGLKE